jgi:uncharacterized protein (TIGR00255 family)
MTGFGLSEAVQDGVSYKIETRSVNHRFCEVSFKLPREAAPLEPEFRDAVMGMFSRGRFDITISRNGAGPTVGKQSLNLPAAEAYVRMLRQLEGRFGLESGIRAVDLLFLRDVLTVEEEASPADIGKVIRPAFLKALQQLRRMRSEEGRILADDLLKRISRLEKLVEKIEKRAPEVLRQYERRMKRAVESFAGGGVVDRGRLLQEMALIADRRDITEEVVRMRSHFAQFRKMIQAGKSAGRRLDFLTQELHREVNTAVSKANDARISQDGVEIKSELEKIREQVQNIE